MTVSELSVLFPKFRRFKIFQRFLAKVGMGDVDGCWEWLGSKDKNGYGWFSWVEKDIVHAHVAAYELFIGKRHGKFVCHTCDNPSCINPSHLWLGTAQQNVADCIEKGRRGKTGTSGENHPQAKLTLKDVEEIRSLYASGKCLQKDLALKFNVTGGNIGCILTNRSWKIQ